MMLKKNDPLTVKEMEKASDAFFPLFHVVHMQMPAAATVEDTLKVMESVVKLGHKLRANKADKEKELKFGFNKDKEDENADS
jgi:hypothetical protein